MMHERTANSFNWSVASSQRLALADSESWTLWPAVGVCAVLLAVGVIVALGLVSRRRRRAPLIAPVRADTASRRKRNLAANSEWWARTQWAMEATVSGNETLNGYGLKMLRELARSEAAGPEEKGVLDAAWQGSSTRMEDDAIVQLLKKVATELTMLPEPWDTHPPSGDVESKPESVRDAVGSPRRKYGSTGRDDTLSVLRREILAARLKTTLDQELGRTTSPKVKRLSELALPPIVRRARDADGTHSDVRGSTGSRE